MRWEDERYVRVYTRDTVAWMALGWEAQALFVLALRKADRTGAIELGRSGFRGLAALVCMPVDVVERCLPILLEDGCLEQSGTTLIVRNFIEAQEASMSPSARQKESRLRRRDQLRAGLDPLARQTVIYFIQSEHGGSIKIGRAEDLAKRLVGLQTSRPDKLVVLAAAPGTVAQERELHERFADSRDKGEWFHPSADLLALVKQVAITKSLVTSCDTSPNVTGHETLAVTPSVLCSAVLCSAEPNKEDPPIVPQGGPVESGVRSVEQVTGPIPEAESSAAKILVEDIRAVFDHWATERKRVFPKSRTCELDQKRRAKITARLREGYTVAELKKAIDGMLSTPFNIEKNFTDIELCLRDPAHVDRYMLGPPKHTGHGSNVARLTLQPADEDAPYMREGTLGW